MDHHFCAADNLLLLAAPKHRSNQTLYPSYVQMGKYGTPLSQAQLNVTACTDISVHLLRGSCLSIRMFYYFLLFYVHKQNAYVSINNKPAPCWQKRFRIWYKGVSYK